MIYYSGYSVSQSEAVVSLLSESLHKSLEPLWASVITHREIVSIEINFGKFVEVMNFW